MMNAQGRTTATVRTGSVRPIALRVGVGVLGLAIGMGLSSLGLIWPWIAFLGVAIGGLVLRRRYPLLLWLAVGVAAGALLYIVLGIALPSVALRVSSGVGCG